MRLWGYFATVLSFLALAACEQPGPAQQTGEQFDQAMSESQDGTELVGDELEQVADQTEDTADENQ